MRQTIKFRLHPTVSQEYKLHKVFKNYNKVRRIVVEGLDSVKSKLDKEIHKYLNK